MVKSAKIKNSNFLQPPGTSNIENSEKYKMTPQKIMFLCKSSQIHIYPRNELQRRILGQISAFSVNSRAKILTTLMELIFTDFADCFEIFYFARTYFRRFGKERAHVAVVRRTT